MTETKALISNLLMGKFSWKSNLERKLRIFEKVIIIHEMKRLQIPPKHM